MPSVCQELVDASVSGPSEEDSSACWLDVWLELNLTAMPGEHFLAAGARRPEASLHIYMSGETQHCSRQAVEAAATQGPCSCARELGTNAAGAKTA